MTDQTQQGQQGQQGDQGQQGQQGQQQQETWYSKAAEDVRGYVEMKGWKDPFEVVNSYKNLEKLTSTPAERLLRLPDPKHAGTPEYDTNLMQVFDRLGRPAKPEEYKLPKAAHRTPEAEKAAQEWFHKAGLTAGQAAKVTELWDAHVAQITQAQAEADTQQATQGVANLNKEWGAAFQKNSAIVDGVAREFGMTAEQLQGLRKALGTEGAMKFMYGIGKKLGEDTFVAVNGGPKGFNQTMTPGEAKARIDSLRNDPEFAARYANGGAKEREEMDRLHRFAYPEPQAA